MKPKTMIVMVVAIACGLGASYMTSQLLAERSQPDEQEKVSVLVAKKNLDMGVILKDPHGLFEEKQYTKGEEPKEAVTSVDQLKGRQLKRSRRAGDWVSEEDLFAEGDSGLQSILPTGYRAVGIRVTPDSIASGFASLPHSRVDIFCTMRKDDRNSMSTLLLEDVLVLAADSDSTRSSESAPKLAAVVTLALTPKEVAKIRLAEAMGPLSLALRGFGEKKVNQDVKAGVSDLYVGLKKDGPVEVNPTPKNNDQATLEKGLHKHVVRIVLGPQDQQFWEYTRDEHGNIVGCRQVDGAAAAPGGPAPKSPPADKTSAAPKTGNLTGTSLIGTTWVGDETLKGYDRLEFRIRPRNEITMIDADGTTEGSYRISGDRIEMDFQGVVYSGTLNGETMGGTAQNGTDNWIWNVRRQ